MTSVTKEGPVLDVLHRIIGTMVRLARQWRPRRLAQRRWMRQVGYRRACEYESNGLDTVWDYRDALRRAQHTQYWCPSVRWWHRQWAVYYDGSVCLGVWPSFMAQACGCRRLAGHCAKCRWGL